MSQLQNPQPQSSEVRTRLAKYIFLDVVQFTHGRSVEAQSHIVEQLNTIVRDSITKHELTTDECILLPTGDGMCIGIIKAESPYDIHIQIALNILESLHAYNSMMQVKMRQFQIRIGVNENVDNVVIDINGRNNLAGAGINMAARVMSQADGNQILVGRTVFETLSQREKYLDKFESYITKVKHGLVLNVYQYKGEHLGLNIETPSNFIKPEKVETEINLTKNIAYYFAYAIKYRNFNANKYREFPPNQNISQVLLWLLARDSTSISETSEVQLISSLTKGFGVLSYEEQFAFYKEHHSGMLLSYALVISRTLLAEYEDFFEWVDPITKLFINEKGKKKLKEEWFEIWKEFDLDKYA